jgi:hypothetical protein
VHLKFFFLFATISAQGAHAGQVVRAGEGREMRPQKGDLVTISVRTLLDGKEIENLPSYSFRLQEMEACSGAKDVFVSLESLFLWTTFAAL